MQRFRGLVAAGFVLTLVLAACGDSDDPEPTPTTEGSEDDGAGTDDTGTDGTDDASGSASGSVPDACELVSAADLEAAFGAAPGAGTPGGGGSRRICSYDNGATVGVEVGEDYEPSAELLRGQESAECSDVTDVGDEAVFCVSFGSVGTLMWRSGDLMYDVHSTGTDGAPTIDAFKQIAAIINA